MEVDGELKCYALFFPYSFTLCLSSILTSISLCHHFASAYPVPLYNSSYEYMTINNCLALQNLSCVLYAFWRLCHSTGYTFMCRRLYYAWSYVETLSYAETGVCVCLSVTPHNFAVCLSGLLSFSLTSSRLKSCLSPETMHGEKGHVL